MELIPQYVYFISKKETLEDLEKYEFHLQRIWDFKVPQEIKDAIEKRKIELTKNQQ
jgi:hypothetical protein